MKDLTGRSLTIHNRSGKYLTEEQEILSRRIEYCSELLNQESCGDNAYWTVFSPAEKAEEDLQPVLREEVKIAVASLKKGKSAGVENLFKLARRP